LVTALDHQSIIHGTEETWSGADNYLDRHKPATVWSWIKFGIAFDNDAFGWPLPSMFVNRYAKSA
jgi:hypothetical protein